MKNKNILYISVSLVFLMLLAFLYSTPVFGGKQLFQHDIVQYRGGAKELLDYRAKQQDETYWSNSMFSGMPTYQMGSRFEGDIIKKVDQYINFLPRPVNYLFVLCAGFFLLGMAALKDWKFALLGATFFGLSTYFFIIIAAGHNGKVNTIEYFAPLLAGIIWIFYQKKYVLGFITTTLFFGLQIAANHPQMTYYLFLGLAFLFTSELIRVFLKKSPLKHFLIASGLVITALVLGVGMNAQRIMANSEYVKETVRGKQILDTEISNAGKTGIDKESLLMWSYGKLETFNLFIPRLMGGGSQEPESEKMMTEVQELIQQNVGSQEEMDRISKGFGSLTYWGEQPGTSGPAYQGAIVCFLAILGFFFAPKKYSYWILGATLLTILLAWGSHFMFLSDFFIDYVPFYNKFRAPSSILVVVELLFPFLAMVGLFYFFKDIEATKQEKQRKLFLVGGVVLGITLLFALVGKGILGFVSDNEKLYFPPFLTDYLATERFKLFQIDAFKALFYIGSTIAILYFVLKNKLSINIALLVIGCISIFDLWTVNKRYLNDSNYVDKIFAENPFQTEESEYLKEKVGDNQNLANLLQTIPMNKVLKNIAEKDKKIYRVYNQAMGVSNETNTSYFLSSIGGYHAVRLRRYDDVLNRYINTPDQEKTPKILNLLNAKYLIFGSPQEPQVVPNPNANGNAWMVSNFIFAKNPNEEIDQLGKIDNKKTAVIGKEDQDYFKNKKIEKDSTATIQLTSYEPNALEYQSKSKTGQLAVFSEIYYPYGWKMYLDNQEVPYIKADYLLRAVYVPAGQHDLKMIFAPEVIEKGKIISMICFLLFILGSGILIFFAIKNKKAKVA